MEQKKKKTDGIGCLVGMIIMTLIVGVLCLGWYNSRQHFIPYTPTPEAPKMFLEPDFGLTLHNFTTGQDDELPTFPTTDEQAVQYLPNEPVVRNLYFTYRQQGKSIPEAIIAVIDTIEASAVVNMAEQIEKGGKK